MYKKSSFLLNKKEYIHACVAKIKNNNTCIKNISIIFKVCDVVFKH